MSKKLPSIFGLLMVTLFGFVLIFAFVWISSYLATLGWNIAWSNYGTTMLSFFLAIDLTQKLNPNLLNWKPIFTNVRDTLVITISLLAISAIMFHAKSYDSKSIEFFLSILGLVLAFATMYYAGTDSLKKIFFNHISAKKENKNND